MTCACETLYGAGLGLGALGAKGETRAEKQQRQAERAAREAAERAAKQQQKQAQQAQKEAAKLAQQQQKQAQQAQQAAARASKQAAELAAKQQHQEVKAQQITARTTQQQQKQAQQAQRAANKAALQQQKQDQKAQRAANRAARQETTTTTTQPKIWGDRRREEVWPFFDEARYNQLVRLGTDPAKAESAVWADALKSWQRWERSGGVPTPPSGGSMIESPVGAGGDDYFDSGYWPTDYGQPAIAVIDSSGQPRQITWAEWLQMQAPEYGSYVEYYDPSYGSYVPAYQGYQWVEYLPAEPMPEDIVVQYDTSMVYGGQVAIDDYAGYAGYQLPEGYTVGLTLEPYGQSQVVTSYDGIPVIDSSAELLYANPGMGSWLSEALKGKKSPLTPIVGGIKSLVPGADQLIEVAGQLFKQNKKGELKPVSNPTPTTLPATQQQLPQWVMPAAIGLGALMLVLVVAKK